MEYVRHPELGQGLHLAPDSIEASLQGLILIWLCFCGSRLLHFLPGRCRAGKLLKGLACYLHQHLRHVVTYVPCCLDEWSSHTCAFSACAPSQVTYGSSSDKLRKCNRALQNHRCLACRVLPTLSTSSSVSSSSSGSSMAESIMSSIISSITPACQESHHIRCLSSCTFTPI